MRTCLPTEMTDYVYDAVMSSVCAPITCDRYHIPNVEPSAAEVRNFEKWGLRLTYA